MTQEANDRGDADVVSSDDTNDIVVDQDKVVNENDKVDKEEELELDEGEEKPKKKILIPKDRFDQGIAKARKEAEAEKNRADQAEARLRAQEGELKEDEVNAAIDVLEEELENAVKDGNTEAKARIRKEIRALSQQLTDSKAAVHAIRATAVAIEQVRYDAAVSLAEKEHPELDPDGDSYDEELVGELSEVTAAFVSRGLSSSESLKKALKVVYRGAKVPVVEKEDKEVEETDVEKEAKQRKADAVERGLKAKGKQPADQSKTGLNSDKQGKKGDGIDVTKISDKDFDKLSPEDLKKLRGD